MATTKKTNKTLATVRKDVEELGRNLQNVGKKLLGDVTDTTLNAAEKALAATLKELQKLRAQMKKPTQ